MLDTTVGKKIVMAVTGQVMVLFAVVHVVGNSLIFFGALNSYVEHLHALPLLVWATRLVMIPALLLHVYFGIVLALENREAKEEHYAVSASLRSTFASRNMIWSGTLVAAFIVYHLLHFTFQVISPEISAMANTDAMGRPDVTGMVVLGLGNVLVALIYIVSLAGVFLHLAHGTQSSFQTLGLSNEKAQPIIYKWGYIAAVMIFIAYVIIPVTAISGLLNG